MSKSDSSYVKYVVSGPVPRDGERLSPGGITKDDGTFVKLFRDPVLYDDYISNSFSAKSFFLGIGTCAGLLSLGIAAYVVYKVSKEQASEGYEGITCEKYYDSCKKNPEYNASSCNEIKKKLVSCEVVPLNSYKTGSVAVKKYLNVAND